MHMRLIAISIVLLAGAVMGSVGGLTTVSRQTIWEPIGACFLLVASCLFIFEYILSHVRSRKESRHRERETEQP